MKRDFKILIFCFVTSLFWFSMYTYVPILSPYAKSIGASNQMAGFIIGSYGFVQMILRIPLGIFSDVIRKRKIFVVTGMVFCTLSSIGMWFTKDPVWLLVFRAMTGVGASTWVIFTVLFTSYFDFNESSKAIGRLNSLNYLGQVTAMFLAGIIAQHLEPKYTFLLSFIGAFIGLLLSISLEDRYESDKPRLEISELFKVTHNKKLLIVSGLAIVVQTVSYSTVYGFTPLAAKQIGASNFQLGILTMLSTIPGIFASAWSGTFFTKRLGARKSVALGFLINAIGCFCIPVIKDVNLFLLSQFVGGFGRGLTYPLLMALSIKDTEPQKRATAMGFFQAIYGIGMFIGPVIVGSLGDSVGLNCGFVFVGTIGALASIMSIILIKDKDLSRSI